MAVPCCSTNSAQSLPASISSVTIWTTIRCASNLASSVMMPGSGAGENATFPEMMLPSMIVLRQKCFCVLFLEHRRVEY